MEVQLVSTWKAQAYFADRENPEETCPGERYSRTHTNAVRYKFQIPRK